MEYVGAAERFLHWLSLAATLVLIGRLLAEALFRRYSWFFAFLLFDTARTLAMLPLQPNTDLYAIVWMAAEPVMWLLYFLIVREVFTLVLREHPGISSLGRTALTLAMVLAAAISLASLSPDLAGAGRLYPILNMVFVTGRAIVTTLVFFLLMITAFMSWFPIPLNRNTIYYCLGYAVLFLGKALAVLLRNLIGPETAHWFSLANLVVGNLCLLVWIWKLNREGETVTITLSRAWRNQDAEVLVAKLASLNKMLAKGSQSREE